MTLFLSSLLTLSITVENVGVEDVEDLAKKVQNPVRDMIAVPIEHNLNFEVGMDGVIQP